ncbi:hypothetical protein [Streptomyces sp. NPDC056672]|uniref:hypothetical protein n=1 Tax=Streptomyces sp. NPDC056672 TaxID=3345906 RepID=UPI0036927688
MAGQEKAISPEAAAGHRFADSTRGFSPRSKYDDHAARRLSETQLGYHRVTHRPNESTSHLRWTLESRAMMQETHALSTEVERWHDAGQANKWFANNAQAQQ